MGRRIEIERSFGRIDRFRRVVTPYDTPGLRVSAFIADLRLGVNTA